MNLKPIARLLSPDLFAVLRRFPLAIVFAAAATLILVVYLNRFTPLDEEEALRLFAGAVTGFVLALAGRLFAESRPEMARAGLILSYLVPLVVAPLFEIRSTQWLALPALPVAALMWLSVSGFTRFGAGAERRGFEDRFWWLNQRAVIAGAIAVAASFLLSVGLFAIDSSLDLLFGISVWDFLADWVLPIVFCLLAPAYWLATLPRLEDYDDDALGKPDFLTRAIGLVGQFILTPLLTIYALILVAYAVQIAVTRTLPVGTLGWLVLSFVVVGAANWLILHPGFVRDEVLSRFFRRIWFWATILPLILFAIGVFVRVDAYGLTPERMLLIAGGVWAALLALFYLLPGGRGDIRLIPSLAGLCFVVLGFGPFNLLAAPGMDQAHRFETALAPQERGGPDWTPEQAARARGALDYLTSSVGDRARLDAILAAHGYAPDDLPTTGAGIAKMIGLPSQARVPASTNETLERGPGQVENVAQTPYFIGTVAASPRAGRSQTEGLRLSLSGQTLIAVATDRQGLTSETDLSDWLDRQAVGGTLSDPAIDFVLGGRRYRLVTRTVQIDRPPEAPARILYLSGWLFSDRAE